MKTGFIAFDERLRAITVNGSGTTAVTCFITPTHVVVANCGALRATR